MKLLIESRAFAERHRFAENQFLRKRSLPAAKIVLFLLNLVQGALQPELDRFFDLLRGVNLGARMVTKAAFSLARRKLHFGAFVEINRVVTDSFYDRQLVHRWRGFRLLAIDGSTARLPRTPEVLEWFGVVDEAAEKPCPIGRVSTLYDVLNRMTVEAHLAPYRVGEHELALQHMARIKPDDLVLLDRGYPAFWLFSLLRTLSIQFCMRIHVNYSPIVERFMRSGRWEEVVDLRPAGEARRECRRRGISVEPVRVRLIRVELSSGEVEVLITSLLDASAYAHEIFGDLYHQRWGIEEGYKAGKCRVEIENFAGKSVHSVMQEFHAKVVSMNFTALLAHQAQSELPPNRGRYALRVNFSHAVARMKETIVRLFSTANPTHLLASFIDLLRRTVEPVRPGRSFARPKRVPAQRFRPTYKRCG